MFQTEVDPDTTRKKGDDVIAAEKAFCWERSLEHNAGLCCERCHW